MRERKFSEAFALTIYKPAIEGLSAAELEELRPDFERMAAVLTTSELAYSLWRKRVRCSSLTTKK
jgi:hypothetical protein